MHFRFARPHPKRTSVKANRHEDIADRLRRLGCTEEQITRHMRKEAVSPAKEVKQHRLETQRA